jgi:hypothetical protein
VERAEGALLELRSRRGREALTIDQLADHLHEFMASHPGRENAIRELAEYLEGAEAAPHQHDGRYEQEELLDFMSEQSFPASDPPSSSVPEV